MTNETIEKLISIQKDRAADKNYMDTLRRTADNIFSATDYTGAIKKLTDDRIEEFRQNNCITLNFSDFNYVFRFDTKKHYVNNGVIKDELDAIIFPMINDALEQNNTISNRNFLECYYFNVTKENMSDIKVSLTNNGLSLICEKFKEFGFKCVMSGNEIVLTVNNEEEADQQSLEVIIDYFTYNLLEGCFCSKVNNANALYYIVRSWGGVSAKKTNEETKEFKSYIEAREFFEVLKTRYRKMEDSNMSYCKEL